MKELEGLTKDGKKRARHTKPANKTKVCTDCGKRKYRDKFAKGRRCIMCKTIYDKKRYLEKKSEIDFRMQDYSKSEKGREVNRKASLEYGKNGKRAKISKRWYERLKNNPKEYAKICARHKANSAVAYALKTGKLIKDVCEVCGASNVHAHHDDYEKKLDVRWLCPLHHGETRRKE